MVKLVDIVKQIRGVSYTPDDLHTSLNKESVVLFRANNIRDGEINYDDVVYVDRKKVAIEQYLKKGDIIICASSGSKELVGKAAYIKHDLDVTFGAFCKVVRPNDLEQAEYISHFFQSPAYRRKISDLSTGVNINNIRNEHIDNLEIIVPPNSEQKSISCLLNQVVSLISLRKKQLQKLDDLVKARFVELFGDPVSNQKGWTVLTWSKIFDTKTGKLDSNASVDGGQYPFFTCAKEWLWIDKYAYDCEALLLAGNNAAGIYDVKHYKGKFNAYQRTYVLQLLNDNWSYSLFKYQLEDKLQYLQSQSKGTNTRYLTMGILNSLSFIVPPKNLQDEFSTFTTQVDKSKLSIQQGLEKLEILKKSLMQQYFG